MITESRQSAPASSNESSHPRDERDGCAGATAFVDEEQTARAPVLASTILETDGTSIDEEKFDTLVKERDSLRLEVTELRMSLEALQSKHPAELSAVQEQLEEARSEKEHAESQYRNLLGKVNTIKSQLGERLKSDAVCWRIAESRALTPDVY